MAPTPEAEAEGAHRPTDQMAGEHRYLIASSSPGSPFCPGQVAEGESVGGLPASWAPPWQVRSSQGTQGIVEAGRTEELKVANLGTSEDGVTLQGKAKLLLYKPSLFLFLTLQKRTRKTDIPSGAELHHQRRSLGLPSQEPSSHFILRMSPALSGSGRLDLLSPIGPHPAFFF